MSYFKEAYEDYVIINRATVDDGEGGYTTAWTDGAIIKAFVNIGSANEQKQAEAQSLKQVYTATIKMPNPLRYGDYIRKARTGEIYRITSDPMDNITPKVATNQACFATAERTELPQ